MPRKSKGKYKPYKINRNYREAEIFRNSSAVLDNTDPYESLKYMKDIFRDKLDLDVITMVFSECACNVDQAFETLMTLCNDENVHHVNEHEHSAKIGIPTSEDNAASSNTNLNETANAYDFLKFQNKSKLAINSSQSSKSLQIPTQKTGIEISNNGYEDGFIQQNHFNLGYDNISNESAETFSFQSKNYSYNDVSCGGYNHYFTPVHFSNPVNSVNHSDSASFSNETFENAGSQFINPFLPTPLYKHGSSNSSTNLEARSTFWSTSRKAHESSPTRKKNTQKKCPIKEADEKIKSGSHVLVILRGLPGSGKSTLAQKLKYSGVVFSTDDFFLKKGKYVFDPYKLNEAHAWNKVRTKRALERGLTPVIVDNTNVEAWEITPYALMGKKHNYEIIILEPNTPWKFNVHELSLRNKHGIPKSKLTKIKERYQHNITVDKLMASIDLLDSKNIDKFTDVADTSKVIVKKDDKIIDIIDHNITKNNISLKAVIHQEDDPNNAVAPDLLFKNNLSLIDSLNPPDCKSDLQFLSENLSCLHSCTLKNSNSKDENDKSCDNSVSDQNVTIHDLDELRALVREDSEDSQSLHSSTNDSSQDTSGWEAITEHDDDFLWSKTEEEKTSASTSIVDFKMSHFIDSQITQPPVSINSSSNRISESEGSSFIKSFIENTDVVIDPAIDPNLNSEKSFESSKNSLTGTKFENILSSNYFSNKIDRHVLEDAEYLENRSSALSALNGNMKKLFIDLDPYDESSSKASILNKKFENNSNSNCFSNKIDANVLKKEEKLENQPAFLDLNFSSEKLRIVSDPLDESEEDTFKSDTNLINSLSSNLFSNKINQCRLESDENLENKSLFSNLKKGSIEKLSIHSDTHDDSWLEISESLKTKTNFSSSENKLKTSFESSVISGNNTNLIVEPKPPRAIHDYNLNPSKSCLAIDKAAVTGISFIDEENNPHWNIIENDAQEEKIYVENTTKIEAVPVFPKPQRNTCDNKSHETNDKISLRQSIPKKSLFNIPIDSIDSDWSFPDYVATNVCETQNCNIPSKSQASAYAQTEPCDFAFVYKMSTETNSLDFSKYTVLNARLNNENKASNLNICNKMLDTEVCMSIVKFDKSTCTDDLVDDIEISQKLDQLHECFPDISTDDLHHLLEICYNDETWISNLLLEWGYRYNVHNENSNNNNNNNFEDVEVETACDSCDNKNISESLTMDKNVAFSLEDSEVSDSQESDLKGSHETISEPATFSNASHFQKLHLVLDSAFACQLQELFGPVTDSGLNVDKCVEIDLEFAKLLHSKWKESINIDKSKTRCQLNDAKVDNSMHLKYEKKCDESPSKTNSRDPMSLSEIMDMEYALQIHKQEKLKKDVDFGTKLKRLELYNMFPGADTIALDEIFESNNYSLKNSLFTLNEEFGRQQTVQHQKQNVEKIDERVVEWSNSNISQEFERGDWSDWVYQEDNIRSTQEAADFSTGTSTISPEAAELREFATQHYKLRQELIEKAKTAYCRGMKDVASFYAQKGAEHGLLFRNANKKASALISRQRNMSTSPHVLDLHGLYIQEAIPALEKFLREKKLDLWKRRQTAPLAVSIITGQGLHSMKGPKLRPSVLEYLKKTGYNFSEINRGMVEVYIAVE